MKRLSALIVLLLMPLVALCAAEPPRGPLASALQPFVDRQIIAGAVMLVADKDKVLAVETVGYASLNTKAPMWADSMFWLASITKTFTATALMMLVDEGKVNVDDPVEKYLPEFKGQPVADAADKTRRHPPQHPVTIKELLTHTSGLVGPNDPPIKRTNMLKEDVEQYAAAPLKWEPGTKYEYNNSGINTAGRIIEVVSGLPYGQFIQQRLLAPLGMTDITFWPDAKQAARLALTSQLNKEKSALEDLPNKLDEAWLKQSSNAVPLVMRIYLGDALRAYPNRYAWPAGGLFSTASDLAKFGQMMLNGGVHHGQRLVSAAAFKRMTTIAPSAVPMKPEPSIGLGWFVKPHDDEGLAAGSFGHNGARGPVLFVDPTHQLVMILLIESSDIHLLGQPRGSEQKNLRTAFFRAAIEKYGKPTQP
ncbi:MAG: serine hydrolase [Kiritimatiellaeota bacterium]|nr:serine hydrolase [Kiritimatiellota bacterium]